MSFMDFLGGGQSENPYTSNKDAFDKYGQEMDAAGKRWQPWMDRGNAAGEAGFNAYNRDINDPNYMQDKIASGYSESPYQKYMQDLVTKRLNYNSANTGMMGSGAAQRALMEELTKNTGQFQNEYINRGLGLYSQALGGMNSIANQGIQAGTQQDELMQEAAGGRLKGSMSENETGDRNRQANAQRNGNIWGSALGLAGGIAGNLFGGPAGGAIGNSIGQYFGGGGNSATGSGGGYSPSNYNNGSWSY